MTQRDVLSHEAGRPPRRAVGSRLRVMEGATVGALDLSHLRARLRRQREAAAAARLSAAHRRAFAEQARAVAEARRQEAAQMLLRLGEERVQHLRARAEVAGELSTDEPDRLADTREAPRRVGPILRPVSLRQDTSGAALAS